MIYLDPVKLVWLYCFCLWWKKKILTLNDALLSLKSYHKVLLIHTGNTRKDSYWPLPCYMVKKTRGRDVSVFFKYSSVSEVNKEKIWQVLFSFLSISPSNLFSYPNINARKFSIVICSFISSLTLKGGSQVENIEEHWPR